MNSQPNQPENAEYEWTISFKEPCASKKKSPHHTRNDLYGIGTAEKRHARRSVRTILVTANSLGVENAGSMGNPGWGCSGVWEYIANLVL